MGQSYQLSLSFACAGGLRLATLVSENRLARELDLVALFTYALHHNLLALFQLITNILDSSIRNLRNVEQAISPGRDFNERAEVHDSRNGSHVGLAHFCL